MKQLKFLLTISTLGILALGVSAHAQVINKRLTIYEGVLRIVDTPDGGTTYHTLEIGKDGTDIASSDHIYLAPDGSNPNAFFQGSAAAVQQGLYINSGTGGYPAVDLRGNSPVNATLYAEQQAAGGYAAYFDGDLTIDGDGVLTATGSKTAVVSASSGRVFLHAVESPEVKFTDYGRGKLKGGTARIALDPVFSETIEGEYAVFLTAIGAATPLTVEAQDAAGFVVRGRGNAAFTYEVVGTRKGYVGQRFSTEKSE